MDLDLLMVLDLSHKLKHLRDDEFISSFDQITPFHTELRLQDNAFGQRSISVLKKAFAKIPRNITIVDISDNELWKLSDEAFEAFTSALPPVIELRANKNRLGLRAGTQLGNAFKKLPSSIRIIYFNENDFNQLSEFSAVMEAFSSELEELYLERNNLGQLNANIEEGFGQLQPHLKKLSLSDNKLNKKPLATLAKLVTKLHAKELNLAFNFLAQKPGGRLGDVLFNISLDVEILNLGNNGFGAKRNEDLNQIFKSLRKRITILLDENILSYDQEKVIKAALDDEAPKPVPDFSKDSPNQDEPADLIKLKELTSTWASHARTLSTTNSDYYFYLKCLAAVSVTTGASLVIFGVLILQSTTVALLGTGFIFASAMCLTDLSKHRFFSRTVVPPPTTESSNVDIELSPLNSPIIF